MNKRRILSLLLCMATLCALLVPASSAADDDKKDDGIVLNKTATANSDGSYTIKLEAYATGTKIISEETKDVPTDIILVLDQSGSMAEDIGSVSFKKYTNKSNSTLYNYRHNNGGSANLWHQLKDGSHVSVSVKREEVLDYTSNTNNTNQTYYDSDNRNDLWALVDGEYQKVTVEREYKSGYFRYTYTVNDYTIANGKGKNNKPEFTSANINTIYIARKAYKYTYSYTDSSNNEIIIETAKGENSRPTTVFYQRTESASGGGSKLNALKSAVTNFVSEVQKKSLGIDGRYGTSDDIEHRVAIVGFASTGDGFTNTELLSTNSVVNYQNASQSAYKSALVAACGTNGQTNSRLTTAINRLDASGDTYLEYGMDMANQIFKNNEIPESDTSGRQRVIVVFTDGYPAPAGTDDFKYSMANNAISQANIAKNTYKATVYTVGVFNAADPTADIVTNFQRDDGWSEDWWGEESNNLTQQQEAVAANRYMHYVSSNYPDAADLNNGGSINPNANPFGGGASYYLSASDAGSLNNIFQQISKQIETGTANTKLDANAVVKDIVAPQFQLPTGTSGSDIRLETFACTGITGNTYEWASQSSGPAGATAQVDGSQISVKGFDFAENFVSSIVENGEVTGYRGSKLVITFTVDPKPGFLGGNNVYTNAGAGIYENDQAQAPLKEFNKPTVNVEIPEVKVSAEDKNVYLLSKVKKDELEKGLTVKYGGENNDQFTIDLSKATDEKEPYGLAPELTAYVNIEVTVKDKDGKEITGNLTGLEEDTEYQVIVTVKPKQSASDTSDGTPAAETPSEAAKANINVFLPTLNYKDSEVYYGATAPETFTGNLVSKVWKHETTRSTDVGVKMTGDEPTMDITYSYSTGITLGGMVNTKTDVPVGVSDVKINGESVKEKVSFEHTACNPACSWTTPTTPGNPAFLIHVKTCQLKITKTGGAPNESYVFNVYKEGSSDVYTQVSVYGNNSETIYELPVGTYTVKEDQGWSWRWTPSYSPESATLDSKTPIGEITCTNSANSNNKWLNGFSAIVQNIFGVKH